MDCEETRKPDEERVKKKRTFRRFHLVVQTCSVISYEGASEL